MARMDPLIRHAITPPVFDRGKVHRERLVDILHANVPRKLTVIAAPPGYGKSTLLADFAAHTDLPVVWVGLTEGDRDLVRLVQVLTASLARRFRRLRTEMQLEALAGTEPEGLARLLARIIDLNVDETFAILMDDVHILNRSQRGLRFLDGLLEVLPEQATLMAAGREVPEISLAKLMAEGELAGLGPHDLALDEEELKAVARERFGAELQDEVAERLLGETRGWITGVLLSATLGDEQNNGWRDGSRPMVFEYLASVVLQRQPDDMRRFMLDAAVLPVMSVEACNVVLDRSDSDRYLRRMVKEGLFVTTTGEARRTYEYHPQMRQFLLSVASDSDIKRVTRLEKRAADYLARQGLVDHAVELYFRAGSLGRAASLAEQQARTMCVNGRVETLEAWAKQLSEKGVAVPKVYLYLATSYNNQGLNEQAKRALDQALASGLQEGSNAVRALAENVRAMIANARGKFKEALRASEKAEHLTTERAPRWLRAMNLRVRAFTLGAHNEDYVHAEPLAAKAVELLEGTDDHFSLAMALVDWSNYQAALGKMAEAESASLRGHALLERLGAPLWLAMSFNNLAVSAHARGQYEEALEKYSQALKNARMANALVREATVLYGQADLFNDLGLSLQAAELYGQGLTIATRIENHQLIRYGCVQTSVLHRRRGGHALALEWLKRATDLAEDGALSLMEQVQMARLEIDLSPEKADRQLAEVLSATASGAGAAERTLAWLFAARAAFACQKLQESQQLLGNAFSVAGGQGTEQYLAAELVCDQEFHEFARRSLRRDPVLSVVAHRMETMNAVAAAYSEPLEQPDEVVELGLVSLGRTDVCEDGESLTNLTPFARELLFYLVDRGRVERDTVIETFWAGQSPGRQTSNLHTAVYALRRAVGKDIIISDGSAYCVNPSVAVEYDVARFERAASVAEGLPPGDPRKLFALTEATNSYGGAYLGEFGSNWVVERRRQLEVRFLDLASQYADEAILRDQAQRAVKALRMALQIDPYRDDLNLRILEALGRLGRRSEMVSHYQRYVRLLADELGLDPPYSVRDAYARLIG